MVMMVFRKYSFQKDVYLPTSFDLMTQMNFKKCNIFSYRKNVMDDQQIQTEFQAKKKKRGRLIGWILSIHGEEYAIEEMVNTYFFKGKLRESKVRKKSLGSLFLHVPRPLQVK